MKQLSKDMVEKVLELNPAMKSKGLDASRTLDIVQRLCAPDEAALPNDMRACDLFEVIASVRRLVEREQKEIAAQALLLKQRKLAAHQKAVSAITEWLKQNDPDRRSPITRELIAQEQALLMAIGFEL